jgi:chaperone required for assembly of F1-ATPase
VLPHNKFAYALADEWQQQGELIDPAQMPHMRFAGYVTDSIASDKKTARSEVLKYARSDLLCYRADGPETLVERQRRQWDPVLDKFKQMVDIKFRITSGIQYIDQSSDDMKRFDSLLAPIATYELGAVHAMTCISGSAILAFAVCRGWLIPDEAWVFCHIDEDFQAELWGRDMEAEEKRQRRYEDFRAASLVFENDSI